MVSVASGGKAERIAARIRASTLRAGSATVAKYSSTVFGAPFPFFSTLESPDCLFLMRSMLQGSAFPEIGRATRRVSDWSSDVCSSDLCKVFVDGLRSAVPFLLHARISRLLFSHAVDATRVRVPSPRRNLARIVPHLKANLTLDDGQ